MTESINEIERARAKARMLTGKTLDPVPTLAQGTKGKSREKVSKKIGMSHGTYDKAKKIWARAKVRMIATQNNNAGRAAVATLPPQAKGKSREKVSKKIGMKPRINTFADRIVLTESVKLIKD